MPDTMIDPKILLKDEIANLPIYKVGAKYEALAKVEANLNAEPLRLGSNENPYGPNPRVIEAIQNTLKDIHRYPDNTCAELATKVGTLRGVDPGRIMFDSGSESVLATLINFCMRRGDKIVSLSPTFPLINILSQAIGAEFIAITHEDDLTFSVEKFCEAVNGGVRMVYLCMPNNPTGTYFTAPEIEAMVAAAQPETLFVLDEAYVEFAVNKSDYPDAKAIFEKANQPYVSLRTMSKAYGLAGMRVGYGVAYCEEFTAMLKRAGSVFNVGILTLEAAMAAIADTAYLENYINVVSSERPRMEQELRSRGARLFNSAGNFICLSLPTFERAQEMEAQMQSVGIFIKSQKGRSGEGVVRMTIGRPEDNDRVLESLVI